MERKRKVENVHRGAHWTADYDVLRSSQPKMTVIETAMSDNLATVSISRLCLVRNDKTIARMTTLGEISNSRLATQLGHSYTFSNAGVCTGDSMNITVR